MIAPMPLDPRKVAAIMAAVQAFLDGETRERERRGSRVLSAWKTAPWRVVRGRGPAPRPSWKHAG